MKPLAPKPVRILAVAAICLLSCAIAFAASTKSKKKTVSPPERIIAPDKSFNTMEGAHYENSFENWQLQGALTDTSGRKFDFTANFVKTGSVYMNIRHGFASLNNQSTGEYIYTAFEPGTLKRAAVNLLKEKIKLYPDSDQIKQALERIENDKSPEVEVFQKEPDTWRNILAVNYDRDQLHRTATDTFDYSLELHVQTTALDFSLHSDSNPVQFIKDTLVPVGRNGSFMGYMFPRLEVKGKIIGPDGKEISVTGTAVMLHFWGEPDRAAFNRFSIIAMPLDDGSSIVSFDFHAAGREWLSSFALYTDAKGKSRVIKNLKLTEGGHWESKGVAKIEYPLDWSMTGAGVKGAITLDDTKHEMSVGEGTGAFYLGPCSFKGTIDKKKKSGAGACRIIAPENW